MWRFPSAPPAHSPNLLSLTSSPKDSPVRVTNFPFEYNVLYLVFETSMQCPHHFYGHIQSNNFLSQFPHFLLLTQFCFLTSKVYIFLVNRIERKTTILVSFMKHQIYYSVSVGLFVNFKIQIVLFMDDINLIQWSCSFPTCLLLFIIYILISNIIIGIWPVIVYITYFYSFVCFETSTCISLVSTGKFNLQHMDSSSVQPSFQPESPTFNLYDPSGNPRLIYWYCPYLWTSSASE